MPLHIKMLETKTGMDDGREVIFHEGIVYYSVPGPLAKEFISNGSAREASLQDMDEQIAKVQEAERVNQPGIECSKSNAGYAETGEVL